MLFFSLVSFNDVLNQLAFKALCLSGGGTKVAKDRLVKAFEKLNTNYQVFITNDAFAALFTAFPSGIGFIPLILECVCDALQ